MARVGGTRCASARHQLSKFWLLTTRLCLCVHRVISMCADSQGSAIHPPAYQPIFDVWLYKGEGLSRGWGVPNAAGLVGIGWLTCIRGPSLITRLIRINHGLILEEWSP